MIIKIDEKIINPPIIVHTSGISSKMINPKNDAINSLEKFTGCNTDRSVSLYAVLIQRWTIVPAIPAKIK